MFAKIDVNGDTAHPLWRFLKAAKKGILGTPAIKWNFTKFLVDRKGDSRRALRAADKTRERSKRRSQTYIIYGINAEGE
jgi:glutathione peroxidase-family protein